MAKRPANRHPRYEIVFERTPAKVVLRSVLEGLKSLGERGGSWVGDAYAVAAKSVLQRKEQLEDLNAERRAAHSPSRRKASV